MSLVEKALRKMQQSSPPARQRVIPAAGRVVLTGDDAGTGEKRSGEPRASSAAMPPEPARSVAINTAALRAAGLLPPEHEEHQLAQQYRKIKRPLVLNALGRGAIPVRDGHVVMIASALSGEGKTFTALNLALSMSMEKDVHVLLVDGDVAKPHLTRLLGAAEEPGLLDALRDPAADIGRLVLGTSVPNLYFLPAGTPSAEATELLASARMEEVIRVLGQSDHRRLVVFDSPPLLQTTESHVLTRVAGQVVVVVRAGQTPQQTLLNGLSYLREHPAVSLVLNQSLSPIPDGYYQSGYGNYDATRSGEPEKKAGT